jgi:glutathione S-transferase
MLTLIIGNRNYSSWSMRPWVLLTAKGIAFDEVMLKFGSDAWRDHIARLSPSRLVPVLWEGPPGDAASLAINDSLAIAEYLHERFPQHHIWPREMRARALARAAAAEMHSGFRALRLAMPMNIRGRLAGKGHTPDALRDVDSVCALWARCRSARAAEGPYLFGEFSAVDAMFAPVAMRFATYCPPVTALAAEYCAALTATPAIAAWMAGARQETEFVAEDEPYATP